MVAPSVNWLFAFANFCVFVFKLCIPTFNAEEPCVKLLAPEDICLLPVRSVLEPELNLDNESGKLEAASFNFPKLSFNCLIPLPICCIPLFNASICAFDSCDGVNLAIIALLVSFCTDNAVIFLTIFDFYVVSSSIVFCNVVCVSSFSKLFFTCVNVEI